ncbi:MAG: DDE-type integrase/transposase/recombinase [Gammaproteobacteria bacterium]|nr:DDE-type integrase/transposase/recombinase [Gammaproteobacteria bacterium]
MRFWLKKIGIIADIEKAFLMVGLQNPDRDVTRFFWVKDIEKPTVVDNLQIYRFCRVPFGVISSPHLLAATINHHLIQSNTATARSIQHQFYVDNLIFGAVSMDEAKSLYTEAKEIMAQASMNLREWACGENEVMQFIPEIDRAKGPVIKVLGLPWNTDMDTLSITGFEQLEDTEVRSKRDMLKQIAKVYDPLGYCAPVTVALKILWQDLWKQKKKWDDPLDKATIDNWKQLTSGIHKLCSYQMSRYIGFPDLKIPVSYELHCFTDASEKAYCAAVYLKMFTDSSSKVAMIFSKVRLAPSGKSSKSLSIPRLELMGVLVGVRSLIFVKELLKLPLENTTLWTDSKCILDWIRSEKQLPVFEHNRVKEITNHRDLIDFRYVPTKDNPADLATRGMLAEDFLGQKRWIQGPEWLESDINQWPDTSIPMVPRQTEEEFRELKNPNIVPFHTMATNFVSGEGPSVVGTPPAGIPIEKFSSLKKLLRVTSWWLKYTRKLKERVAQRKGEIPKANCSLPLLSASEIHRARVLWDKHVQSQSFQSVFDQLNNGEIKSGMVKDLNLKKDVNGFLHCYGRYSNVELPDTSRFPILMPKIHPYTRLLIMDCHHKTFHSWTTRTLVEIRKNYWIPQGRQMVQAVLKSCKVCLKQMGGPYQVPLMPAWPKERVSRSPPYSYVGIDYLGPLRIKDRRGREEESRKIWICLFTCMATRAIHLEVVHDMTANQFLDAVRRFVAYKGTPKLIISDNASQFKLVNKVFNREWRGPPNENNEVQSYLADRNIEWKFIPEIAPWMGGFYERMVGEVKKILRRVIGKRILMNTQMQTLVAEVSAVVNSWPLVYVGSECENRWVLTPSDLLGYLTHQGSPDLSEPKGQEEYLPNLNSTEMLVRYWRDTQNILNQFWQLWREEYLTSLRERNQYQLPMPKKIEPFKPSINDVVQIKEDLPRGSWKLGKIQELIFSKDGQSRAAQILLPNKKILTRAIKHLYPLEIPFHAMAPSGDTQKIEINKDSDPQTNVGLDVRPTRAAAERAKQRIEEHLAWGSVAECEYT